MRMRFYTNDVHNPAVLRGIMEDAFMYVSKYHGVQVHFSCPQILVDPELQMLIDGRDAAGNGSLHWSWETFSRLLRKKEILQAGHYSSFCEMNIACSQRLEKAVTNPGREFLTLVIHDQARASVADTPRGG